MAIEKLWQDYAFLTREISKFIIKRDFSLVNTLLDQREQLRQMITASGDEDYRVSPAGQKLLTEIMGQEKQIGAAMKLLRNKMQQQHTVSGAYESMRAEDAPGRLNNIRV